MSGVKLEYSSRRRNDWLIPSSLKLLHLTCLPFSHFSFAVLSVLYPLMFWRSFLLLSSQNVLIQRLHPWITITNLLLFFWPIIECRKDREILVPPQKYVEKHKQRSLNLVKNFLPPHSGFSHISLTQCLVSKVYYKVKYSKIFVLILMIIQIWNYGKENNMDISRQMFEIFVRPFILETWQLQKYQS